MKIKLNPMFEEARGQLGDLVFREVRGKTFASRKASNGAEPTVDQVAQRERFKQAAAYGKSALADQTTRQLYEDAAKSKDMPIFALTVADFFNAPVVNDVDLAAYNGHVGETIKIRAMDDFGVANVYVTLIDFQSGATLETGTAVETAPGSGVWLYTAQTAVNAGNTVNIQVAATDRPGGTAVVSRTKTM